jgi:nicotinamide mononucleotide transporter
MSIDQIVNEFIAGIKETGWMEYIAVFSGIASVWYSRKENILVYPTGLLNTIFYIYLSFKGGLFGEASVNFYYTVMSIYGWVLWSKKDEGHHIILKITKANRKEWTQHLLFFASFYIVIFFALTVLKKSFSDSVIPWADAFASATAFTGMWLMAKKKVESWYWWIATNIASIPLYFVKHYVFTSVYYVILLIMAVFGLIAWLKKTNEKQVITDEPGTHLGLSS